MSAAREAARIRVGVIMEDMGGKRAAMQVLMGSDNRNEKRIPLRESSFRRAWRMVHTIQGPIRPLAALGGRVLGLHRGCGGRRCDAAGGGGEAGLGSAAPVQHTAVAGGQGGEGRLTSAGSTGTDP